MNVNVNAAARVAGTLGVLKWIVVGWCLLSGVLGIWGIAGAESWPEWTLMLEPVVGLGAVLAAVVAWVLFGWFQHTLGMLAAIASTVTAQPVSMELHRSPDFAAGGQVVSK